MAKKPVLDTDPTLESPTAAPRGRFKAAWSVWRGESITPPEIRAQWISYQIAFDSIFDKLSVSLARLAKREQRAIATRMETIANEPTTSGLQIGSGGADRKAELRARVFGGRFPTRANGEAQSQET